MNIALIEPLRIPDELLRRLAAPLTQAGHHFTAYGDKAATPPDMLSRVLGQDIVIIANTPFPASVVLRADRLKLLNVAFTGIDHVALDACKEKGVTVCNCANYSNQSVAEMTVGISWLKWLSYGLEFGTESPFILNLSLLRLTFGISVKITVSMILFISLSLLLGRVIAREK